MKAEISLSLSLSTWPCPHAVVVNDSSIQERTVNSILVYHFLSLLGLDIDPELTSSAYHTLYSYGDASCLADASEYMPASQDDINWAPTSRFSSNLYERLLWIFHDAFVSAPEPLWKSLPPAQTTNFTATEIELAESHSWPSTRVFNNSAKPQVCSSWRLICVRLY